ncbi:MAG: SGNH/GDSL hydrolase family protein, partial [Pseudomonadota bacterium]
TDLFNGLINGIVADLNSDRVNVTLIDVAAISAEISADPAAFGFTNATDTCNQGATSCDGLVFWDGIHPTDATHALVADAVIDAVTPIPLPAGAPLLLVALGALGVASRRRVAGRSD